METITIHTPFIRLDAALKLSGAALSGGQAKELVQNRLALVNGEPCTLRGKKLYPGDTFSAGGKTVQVQAT